MKNVVRSVIKDTKLVNKELEAAFAVFKVCYSHSFTVCMYLSMKFIKMTTSCVLSQEEYLSSYYWRIHRPQVDILDKYDPNKPYYELYRIDYDQFKTLYLAVSPWATGQFADTLALRTFRVTNVRYCVSPL